MLISLNKPYGVLCRFTGPPERPNLSEFVRVPGIYPAGRLDLDSEGLLLLTDDGQLQNRISSPRFKMWKTYWVQVEGIPSGEALETLRKGVGLKEGVTMPARAESMAEPEGLWPRVPPIRYRARIPASWIRLSIREGRNRQVRRMTAAVGHPTLRLIRYGVGGATLDGLGPGQWRYEDETAVFGEIKKRTRIPGRRR